MDDILDRAYALTTSAIVARLARVYVDPGSSSRAQAFGALVREARRQQVGEFPTAVYDVQQLLMQMYPSRREQVDRAVKHIQQAIAAA